MRFLFLYISHIGDHPETEQLCKTSPARHIADSQLTSGSWRTTLFHSMARSFGTPSPSRFFRQICPQRQSPASRNSLISCHVKKHFHMRSGGHTLSSTVAYTLQTLNQSRR